MRYLWSLTTLPWVPGEFPVAVCLHLYLILPLIFAASEYLHSAQPTHLLTHAAGTSYWLLSAAAGLQHGMWPLCLGRDHWPGETSVLMPSHGTCSSEPRVSLVLYTSWMDGLPGGTQVRRPLWVASWILWQTNSSSLFSISLWPWLICCQVRSPHSMNSLLKSHLRCCLLTPPFALLQCLWLLLW